MTITQASEVVINYKHQYVDKIKEVLKISNQQRTIGNGYGHRPPITTHLSALIFELSSFFTTFANYKVIVSPDTGE